jgi:predicted NUDIX family NTP pyrophosphohydrolase
MPQESAGILMYRRGPGGVEVLLVHPGGPFWKNKDAGAWSIPKGVPNPGEELLDAARREFREETGFVAAGEARSLGSIKQKAGKTIHAWAVEGEIDSSAIRGNTFSLEWPPKSGKRIEVAEVDRAVYFQPHEARTRINPAQATLIDRLEDLRADPRTTVIR